MLVIHDTTVVTVDADDTVIFDGAVVIDGANIVAVGPSNELLRRFEAGQPVSGRGKAVLPGFANLHTHLELTLARGIYEDMSPPHNPPFIGGMAELPLPALTIDERRAMCQLGALEALRSGTTALLEDSENIGEYAQAMVDCGLRFTFTERTSDRANASFGEPGPFVVDEAAAESAVARTRRAHADWQGAGDGRIRIGVSAHSPDMCSPQLLSRLRELQDELDCVATIHLSQMWGEVEAVKIARGKLPTEYLAQHGFLNERLIAAHCRCMQPSEDALLGQSGATVAFNSAIASRRGLSPHIRELGDAGARIGLGTDNMSEDMVEAMRTGLFMERVRRADGRDPQPEEVLRWATVNGYAALGLPGGSLEAGNPADLIMIELRQPHLVPLMRVVSTFVHQGRAGDVADVMVGGRWLMRNREVSSMDEAAIVAQADLTARRAWAKLLSESPDLPVPNGFDARSP